MAPTPHLHISSTIGAWLIGTFASIGLLGITTLQCWIYYTRFPRDPRLLKVLVLMIWCLEVLRAVVCAHGGYYYTVTHWGDFPVLSSEPHWGLKAIVPLTAIIGLLAHAFFSHQVRSITRGKFRILFYTITIFSVGDFVFGIASYILAEQGDTFRSIVFGLPSHIASAALGCAIIADWTITASLVMFLRKNKTQHTRTLMHTLILYAINFGLLISLTDLVVLIMANVKWNFVNLYQVSLFEVIGNLYANTMLASLNSRTLVAEHLYHAQDMHFTSINAPSAHLNDLPSSSTFISENDHHHVAASGHVNVSHTDGSRTIRRGGSESSGAHAHVAGMEYHSTETVLAQDTAKDEQARVAIMV